MTSETPEPVSNPDTFGYRTILVEIEAQPVALTAEVLNRPRYGRPDPRRYLDNDAPPESSPPGGPPKPA